MIKAIILDLDGTVGYTMPELQKAMNETLRSFGYPEHTVEELYQWVNFHAHEWIKGCFPDGCTDEEIAAGHKKYNEIYGKYYHTVTAVLRRAGEKGRISAREIRQIVSEAAFSESSMYIPEALTESWFLLDEEAEPVLRNLPSCPLTVTEKRGM